MDFPCVKRSAKTFSAYWPIRVFQGRHIHKCVYVCIYIYIHAYRLCIIHASQEREQEIARKSEGEAGTEDTRTVGEPETDREGGRDRERERELDSPQALRLS